MVEDKSGNRKYGVRQISHFTKKNDDDDEFVWEIRHCNVLGLLES